MSATINVFCPEIDDSIEIYVEPEEKIEEIIERCRTYWQLEGDQEEYALMRNNNKLSSGKSVISSDLQDNDVVKLWKEEELKKEEIEEPVNLKPEEILSLAERWLKDNIGVKSEELELVEKQDGQIGTNLQFKNTELDEQYTVLVKGNKVERYIPALIDKADIDQL